MLLERVKETILKYNMINKNDIIIVGVSGGYDSIVLADVLIRLRNFLDYKLVLAHINHCVRGEESDDDEKYVRSFAENNKLKLFVKKIDMNEYSKKNKLSPEEAGRRIRYDFFNNIIEKEFKSGKIAIAHNKNDNVETVILNLMRGTSIEGLKGIDYVSRNVIRPILDISREDIESYCELRKLNPRLDSTNLERIYRRNKVRLDIIPFIEKNFNNKFIDSVSKMSHLLREDDDFLYGIAKNKLKEITLEETEFKIVIDNIKFNKFEKSIKSRILKIIINRIRDDLKGINYSIITEILYISNSNKTGKKKNLFNDYTISVSYDKLILEKIGNFDKIRYNYKVRIFSDSEVLLEEISKKIFIKRIDKNNFLKENRNKNVIYLKDDSSIEEIIIRNRKSGDRIKLKGMSGSKKLKDYFIDKKVPRENREEIPIIEAEGKIIGLLGYGVSEDYSIKEETEKIIKIEISNI